MQCTRCKKWLDLDDVKYAYESDDPYCESCLDNLEAYWQGVAEDRDIDAYEEQERNAK